MRRRLGVRTLLAPLAGLALCGFQASAQFVAATRIHPPDRMAARRDAADRMTVQVKIDGRGPYPFVIDTCADRTVVSRELAADLKLEPGAPVVLNGTASADVTPTARIDELDVGARTLHDIAAPTLATDNLGAQGLLGIDSLSGQRMVMDFRNDVMSVEPSRRRD